MKVLENKIPPPLVMLFFACVMFGVSKLGLTFTLESLTRRGIIALLLISGLAIALSGVRSFKKAKTTVNPLKPDSVSSLVDSGIYQITRNPMYVGLTLVLAAWAVYLSSWIAFSLIPLFIIYITKFQIIPEERALKRLFGDEFSEYKSKVRRWL